MTACKKKTPPKKPGCARVIISEPRFHFYNVTYSCHGSCSNIYKEQIILKRFLINENKPVMEISISGHNSRFTFISEEILDINSDLEVWNWSWFCFSRAVLQYTYYLASYAGETTKFWNITALFFVCRIAQQTLQVFFFTFISRKVNLGLNILNKRTVSTAGI